MLNNAINLSVRDLVEWVLRSGSIDNTYISNKRNVDGINIHKLIQSSYTDLDYEKEVNLEYTIGIDDYDITIAGRADGIFFKDNIYFIEEIKSTVSNLDSIELNEIHLAQAKCYAYMFSKINNLRQICIIMTYVNIESLEKKCFESEYSIEELEQFLYDLINRYLDIVKYITKHQYQKLSTISNVKFPYKKVRKGQRQFATAVYTTIKNNGKLIAQAPTGIGKTIAALYPAIKSFANNSIQKVFYLTPKETTKLQAKETMKLFLNSGLHINTLILTSKEKICPKEIKRCNKDYCEYALGHFDRVNNAIFDLINSTNLFDRETIEIYAKKYTVCPFEFSLDLSLFSDIIVCDYNYVFDPMVYLRRFFDNNPSNYVLLVDEAHNLPERSRDMYSFTLKKEDILNVKNQFKHIELIKKQLDKINRIFIKYKKLCNGEGFYVTKEKPYDLLNALYSFVNTILSILNEQNQELNKDYEKLETLLQLFFDTFRFIKISEFFNDNFVILCEEVEKSFSIKICCLDSSELVSNMLNKVHSSILFSATLIPSEFFKKYFSSEGNAEYIKIKSPFDENNRLLLVLGNISTKYKDRMNTIDEICKSIIIAISIKKGNYMVFFPSYEYMNLVKDRLLKYIDNDTDVIFQTQNMTDHEKIQFLSKFEEDSFNTTVGLSVLGGAFSEGIDFDGDKLIGIIIVGVGIPQINIERNLIKEHFNKKGVDGFDYAYTYPGIIKVIQSIGRLIRTETDRGFILLIDQRYKNTKYKNLLLSNFENIHFVKTYEEISCKIKLFWDNIG
ncbi:ATP-dependent DNA helicase [Caldicellulosiruptoraceae bacterium PP1]